MVDLFDAAKRGNLDEIIGSGLPCTVLDHDKLTLLHWAAVVLNSNSEQSSGYCKVPHR
jgi:hypothetical protein